MTLPKDAFCPEQMRPLVESGWATNRHRDRSDGHDRSPPNDKLRTALLAMACGDPDAINEGLALIVETELDLRNKCTRPVPVIKEALVAIKHETNNGQSDARHKVLQVGATAALAWTLGIIDTATLEQMLGCQAN